MRLENHPIPFALSSRSPELVEGLRRIEGCFDTALC
jgi:hypothetical protein